MAEEMTKQRRYYKSTQKHFSSVARFAVLQTCLLCGFSCLFGATQNNPEMIPSSTVSDPSVPLWGGGSLATISSADAGLSLHEIKLHHFDDKVPCGSCHQTPAESAGLSWKDGLDVNRSCTSFGCHQYDEKMNHPLDVPLPVGLEIDPKVTSQSSTVTCLSCHQPQDTEIFDTLEGEPDYYLQDPAQVGCDT